MPYRLLLGEGNGECTVEDVAGRGGIDGVHFKGTLLGAMIGKQSGFTPYTAITIAGGVGGLVVGGVGGLLIGSHKKEWETFKIEGESPEGIKIILDGLRSRARVPDFR